MKHGLNVSTSRWIDSGRVSTQNFGHLPVSVDVARLKFSNTIESILVTIGCFQNIHFGEKLNFGSAPLKLRPYGAIQMRILLLLLLLL